MKYSDLISGIFWLVIGLLFTIWSTHYQIGNLMRPGSGLLPLGLGILLILLSLIFLLGQAKKSFLENVKEPFFTKPGGWRKVAYAVLILILATFTFEKLGYLLTIFLLIVFLMLGAEFKSWKRIILAAFFTALGIYLVFVLLLEQPLPRGLLRY
ncbi:MAG: hypothetical protein A2169_07550 [Deltaproteobacteria bacterium RBG_13_47_9]|nr:MAG: hypothetical protein A2169_07550 [Deltaproteobacteria bacterium RBG_13_47_9]